MNPQIPFYLISAELATRSAKENATRTDDFETYLINNNISHKLMVGCYKGTQEYVFLITGVDIKKAQWLSKSFSQEAFIYCNPTRETDLIDTVTGEAVYLGKMTEISEADAIKLGNWTKDLETGRYYAATKAF